MASNLRVDSIVPSTGTNVSIGTSTGGVNIPGVLTYEDVTNVDSIGIITARSGVHVGPTAGVGATIYTDGGARYSGIITATAFHGDVTGDVSGSGASLTNLPSAQLTGALPAISGANLTNLPASGKFASYAVVCDQKANNTDGGTFSNGAWRTRDLNREVCDDDGIVTVANNKFTLGAGTYFIRWSAPAAFCARHQSKLHNDTDNQTLEYGNNCFADNGNNGMNNSMGSARVTIGATKDFEIRHQCATTVGGDGFGVGNNFGGVCIYTVVEIFKQN